MNEKLHLQGNKMKDLKSYEDYYNEHIGGDVCKFKDLNIFAFKNRLKAYRTCMITDAYTMIGQYFNDNDIVSVYTLTFDKSKNKLVGDYWPIDKKIKDEFINTKYTYQKVHLQQGAFVLYELKESNLIILIKKTFGPSSMTMPLEMQYIYKTIDENIV